MNRFWEEDQEAVNSVTIAGIEVSPGSRVQLYPRGRADIFDLVLAGKTAIVSSIEQDLDDNLQIAVMIEDDPGRDLGEMLQPGHRFFFSADEIVPLAGSGDSS